MGKIAAIALAIGFALVLLHIALRPSASARIVQMWTIETIAKEAQLIVVGKITSIETTAKVPAERTRWGTKLLRRRVTLHVLRAIGEDVSEIAPTGKLTFEYLDYDGMPYAIPNGPMFPQLSVGQVMVFPLRKNKEQAWELLDEEDNALLYPAAAKPIKEKTALAPVAVDELIAELGASEFETREKAHRKLRELGGLTAKPLRHAAAQSADAEVRARAQRILAERCSLERRVDFIRTEIAGAFAKADAATAYRVAHKLWDFSEKDAAFVHRLLAETLKANDPRWLRITVALYAATWMEKPVTLTDWVKSPPPERKQKHPLAAQAFAHVSKDDLDKQIIREVLATPGVPYANALTVLRSQGHLNHPLTNALLLKGLRQDRADMVALAFQLQRSQKMPEEIRQASVAAALKAVHTVEHVEHDAFYSSCQLIVKWGDAVALKSLFDEYQRTRTAQPKKYRRIWDAINWTKNKNVIPFVAAALDVRSQAEGDRMRMCDRAVYSLHYATGQSPKMESHATEAERDKTVEQAKAWLKDRPELANPWR